MLPEYDGVLLLLLSPSMSSSRPVTKAGVGMVSDGLVVNCASRSAITVLLRPFESGPVVSRASVAASMLFACSEESCDRSIFGSMFWNDMTLSMRLCEIPCGRLCGICDIMFCWSALYERGSESARDCIMLDVGEKPEALAAADIDAFCSDVVMPMGPGNPEPSAVLNEKFLKASSTPLFASTPVLR